MLGTKSQVHPVEATAALVGLYARTGTRLARASAEQGITLWVETLQLAARRADAQLNEWRGALLPWMDLSASLVLHPAGEAAREGQGPEPAYASYRTGGGHAASQIIAPGTA